MLRPGRLSALVFLAAASIALASCALFSTSTSTPVPVGRATELLPDVRIARERPPVVLVARDGDPAHALAFAITLAGVDEDLTRDDEPDVAVALAGVLESRIQRAGFEAQLHPSYDGVRGSLLVLSDAEAVRAAKTLQAAMSEPVSARDLESAETKRRALGMRPLEHEALRRWAQCTGDLRGRPRTASTRAEHLERERLERWRKAALGSARVAFAITAPKLVAERVAASVLDGPAWPKGAPLRPEPTNTPRHVAVMETVTDRRALPTAYITLGLPTSGAAVEAASRLGSARSALALRLRDLALPFSVRDVTSTSHPRGGCLAVAIEASPSPSSPALSTEELATRAAEAIALVEVEAIAASSKRRGSSDGRQLARQTGDAREAAERAAWWNLADRVARTKPEVSVTLAVSTRRNAEAQPLGRVSRALETELTRASKAWETPMLEVRSRIEAGQGEAWVLVGSPCGTDGEVATDTGVTSLAIHAMAESLEESREFFGDATLEPWVSSDGAGIVAHGLPLPGESAVEQAERLADAAARAFLTEPLSTTTLARTRTELLRRDAGRYAPSLGVLGSVLAPRHPSLIAPFGSTDVLSSAPDGAVTVRAQALRKGPVRLATLATHGEPQVRAATLAADRWLGRDGAAARACPSSPVRVMPSPGTYSASMRPGALPEAYLAFPFAAGDARMRRAATMIATAIGSAFAQKHSDGSPSVSARVLGWPKVPSLAIHVVATQGALDDAVSNVRALISGWRKTGLSEPEFERIRMHDASASRLTLLEPRARLVATWRSEPIERMAEATRDEVQTLLTQGLSDESLVTVIARPPRAQAPP